MHFHSKKSLLLENSLNFLKHIAFFISKANFAVEKACGFCQIVSVTISRTPEYFWSLQTSFGHYQLYYKIPLVAME